MTPQDLIAAFEQVAEAPEGVTRLRQTVLQLAVRGRLVPQDPEDEPASVLLERLRRAQREWLARNAPRDGECSTMLRKLSKLPGASPPYPIPFGWTVAHLLELSRLLVDCHNKTAPYSETGVPLVRTVNIRDRKFRWAGLKYVTEETYAYWSRRCPPEPGDIMFTREAPMGEAAVIPPDHRLCLGQRTMLIRPMADHVLAEYILTALTEPGLLTRTTEKAIGSTVKHFRVGDVERFSVMVPPLAEQHRIVARVDELMGLLDRLEAARTARDTTRAALRDAALAALAYADTAEEVEAAWDRIAECIDDLFTRPEDVEPLRQTVLQLAVRGRLVSQDPDDEPASVLLGKRSLETPDEPPFDLPEGWSWTNLGRLGEVRGGGTPSKRNPAFWEGPIPWVSPKDMKRDLIGESILTVTEAAISGSSVKRIPRESLLMVVRGMILAHSFPTALTTAEVTVNQDMKALLPFDVRIAPFLLVATKGHKRRVLDVVERSTHGTCKLPTTSLFALPIAVPPLAEQHRIVAKVDSLMTLLDDLEERLRAAHDTQAAFAAAAVHHMDA